MQSWNNSLRIGVAAIDAQHRQLCDAIDNLLDACRVGKGKEEVLDTLNFLERYTIRHFRDEEELQAKCGYPKCTQHKALHDGFIEKIGEVKEEIEKNGANVSTVITVNMMLVEWLIKHITVVDKEISNYTK